MGVVPLKYQLKERIDMTIKNNKLMKQIADELYREMQEGLGF